MLLNVNYCIAQGAGVLRCIFVRAQPAGTGRAGELNDLRHTLPGVDVLMAYRANFVLASALVEYHIVPAVRAGL